jgi:hypothetical protein
MIHHYPIQVLVNYYPTMCSLGVTFFTHPPNMASRGPGNLMLAEGVDPTLPVARHPTVNQ